MIVPVFKPDRERKVKLRGLPKVDWLCLFSCAAFNLLCIPKPGTQVLATQRPCTSAHSIEPNPSPDTQARFLSPNNPLFNKFLRIEELVAGATYSKSNPPLFPCN